MLPADFYIYTPSDSVSFKNMREILSNTFPEVCIISHWCLLLMRVTDPGRSSKTDLSDRLHHEPPDLTQRHTEHSHKHSHTRHFATGCPTVLFTAGNFSCFPANGYFYSFCINNLL